MSGEIKKALAPLKPLANIVKGNSTLITTLFFCVIALQMLPLDLFTTTDIKKRILSKVNNGIRSDIGRVLIFLLFLCLYMNSDVENMVLLLYVIVMIHN